MPEIKCPNCGEIFTIDQSKYQEILSEIKNKEFNKELEDRLAKEHELAKAKLDKEAAQMKADKDAQIAILQTQIEQLKGQSKIDQSQRQIEINKAVEAEKAKVVALEAELKGENARQELAVAKAIAAQKEVIAAREAEIVRLKGEAQLAATQNDLNEKAIKESYESKLKLKEDEVAYYKDLKAKMSTKMIGETLEQHCELTFENVRAAGFQNAYFGKDNDATSGSKGDYIFRDKTDDGVEFISIMFEMKNEMDTTATKHKNADFFKELDKDRNEKGCEYAVLVSLLEADSDYYNQGIVDVSYKSGYEKMYVIRPQFFLPFITMVRNAAMKNISTKRALIEAQNQNIDITNFESGLAAFKEGFTKNVEDAAKQFNNSIDEIDKIIDHLTKMRENLVKTGKHLATANKKVDGITIKKLTKDNPTMRAKFEEAAKQNAIENED